MAELLNGTTLDSVRIEVLGGGRALMVPCSLIIDLNDALKMVREDGFGLLVYKVGETLDGTLWLAEAGKRGEFHGTGCSPLQAIANLRKEPTDG